METTSIYREAALERLSTPERLDQGLSVVGTASWSLIWGIVLLAVGGLIWSAVVVVPVTVKGQGILLSSGGVLDVTSGSQGRVITFAHRLGEIVHKSTVVATIDQPQLRLELSSAEGDLRDAMDQRRRTFDFQTRRSQARNLANEKRRQALIASIAVMTENSKLFSDRVDLRERFSDQGLTTKDKYLESKLELGRQREELSRARVTLTQMEEEEVRARTEDEKELLTLDLRTAGAERHVENLSNRLKAETSVESPYDGTIAEIKVNPGELVDRGTSLFSIIPTNPGPILPSSLGKPPLEKPDVFGPLAAIIYVAPSFGKQINVGDATQVAISTARREEYGFVLGRVRAVAEIPSTGEGMLRTLKNKQLVQTLSNNAAPFEVVVDLYADAKTPSGYKWSSSRGPDLTLNDGTLVDADVEVRSLPVLSLIVPQIRQLVDKVKASLAPSKPNLTKPVGH